jgi:hypothetical protein
VAAGDNPGRLRSEAAFAGCRASGAPAVPLLPPPAAHFLYRLSHSQMTYEPPMLALPFERSLTGYPLEADSFIASGPPMTSSDKPKAPGHRAVPGGPLAIGPRRSRYKA